MAAVGMHNQRVGGMVMRRWLAKDVMNDMCRKKTTPLSLREMFEMAQGSRETLGSRRLTMAQYLHRELPIRMAQRIEELRRLPYGLGDLEDVAWITETYARYVESLSSTPRPTDAAEEAVFAEVVKSALFNRVAVPQRLSRAVRTATPTNLRERLDFRETVDGAMERFFTARIGLRLLVDHYLSSREGRPGEIASDCRPAVLAREAGNVAAGLCRRDLGVSPRVDVVGDLDAAFTYPPQHCRYILLELLKNATRATAEAHRSSTRLPPVQVVVVGGDEDITVRVSDVGGGFTRTQKDLASSWFQSTYPFPDSDHDSFSSNDPSLLTSGHGIGLPLSRCHALYFGGSFEIFALQGHGLDAYIHLSRLGTDCENLPSRVRYSPASRDSTLL